VLVFPSRHESFGHVVLEAMASGAAVVGYDLPVLRDLYGDAMLRVEVGNQRALADAVIYLLRDGRLRETYAERGRDIAKQHTWLRESDVLATALARVGDGTERGQKEEELGDR